jgi:hypothetical protein
LLKNIKYEILEPLTLVINQCLHHGIFPDKLKTARISPIFKKDDKTLLNNYRPISVLPPISKVLEKIIFNQIDQHFRTNNLYYSNQYGFRQNHSTEHATIELVDRITDDLDNGNIPLNIYIDLTKAFDTVDHNILLEKLHHYGIRNTPLSLMKSYLSNRYQYVEIDHIKSDSKLIHTGVPQGSVLGPLFFIIYLNDIHKSSNIFHFLTYADDTTLYITINTLSISNSSIEENLNSELESVCQWLTLNSLSLNVSKTKFMVFKKSNRQFTIPTLKIENQPIEYVETFSFLGLIIDSKLNWKAHINNIAKKISKANYILAKFKHFLPENCLKAIYNSLINSHLNYCMLCWGYQPKQLIKLQKKAVRNITNSKFNAHSEPLLKKLQILKLNDMLNRKILNFYFMLQHRSVPDYFLDTFQLHRQQDRHDHHTRTQNFICHRIYHSFACNSLRYRLPKLLNSISSSILEKVDTHSQKRFSFYIKMHFIQQYQDSCTVNNCCVCNR